MREITLTLMLTGFVVWDLAGNNGAWLSATYHLAMSMGRQFGLI